MRTIACIILLTLGYSALAQKDTLLLDFEGSDIVVKINQEISHAALDSLLCSYGTCMNDIDDLWLSEEKTTPLGWVLEQYGDDWIQFRKPVKALSGKIKKEDIVALEEEAAPTSTNVSFGSNRFKAPLPVYETETGTMFFLDGYRKANEVFLAGSFNDWDPRATPMTKTYDGWECSVKLAPGKHLYKFVVDGNWIEDPNNKNEENDGHWGENSIYFKPNYQFKLEGHDDAKKVVLSGSFNYWNENRLKMDKTSDGWVIDVYLREGTYTYKFIVDGEWILDPANPDTRPNEFNGLNSVVSIGDPVHFTLNGFASAEKVVLSGSFNNWNEYELQMQRVENHWEYDLVLPPGNYEYKFMVDGNWIKDPANQVKIGDGQYMNSVKVVEPNTHFSLPAHGKAQEVILSGSFNGWSTTGYTMVKDGNNWVIDLHLPQGKYTYKFVVDGEWITDPENQLFEGNEYGGYNSVYWVE